MPTISKLKISRKKNSLCRLRNIARIEGTIYEREVIDRERTIEPPRVERTIEPPRLERTIEQPNVERTIEPPRVERTIEQPNVERTIEPPRLERTIEQPNVERTIEPPRVERTIEQPNVERTIEPPRVERTIEQPNVERTIEPPRVERTIEQPNVERTIEPPRLERTIEQPNVERTIEPPRVERTIEQPNVERTIEPPRVERTIEQPNVERTIEPPRVERTIEQPNVERTIEPPRLSSCKNWSLDLERRKGLSTECIFKCACGWVAVISSDSDCNTLPINDSFAWGCECSPVGFSAATSLLTTMDLPCPDPRTFKKAEESCKALMEEAFVQEMKENLARERELAVEANSFVVVEGVKYAAITVCVDGGWSKRSYGHTYTANCGIGVIIGMQTKKIIFADTRCSTCIVCDKGNNENRDHDCPKNWSGPATAMESDILTNGFAQSRLHEVVFTKFIGDGDSSFHANVEDVYPGIKVKKIECKNHLYKNLTKKCTALAKNKITGKNAKNISIEERRNFCKHLHRIPIAIKMAVKHYIENKTNDSWKYLKHDILNIPFHIFGRHIKCKSYFCDTSDPSKAVEADRVAEMMTCSFWEPLNTALRKISNESYSLIENQTSNASESFMSVANKFMEGKRKNMGQKGLYRHRMLAAVFSYNNCSFWPAKVYTTLLTKPPSFFAASPDGLLEEDGLLELWEVMKINMEYFWENDLAPELVDSRFDRGYTEYRCPESRKDAVAKKANKKTLARKRNHTGQTINNLDMQK
ncbi:Serum response factor-binding protein 1 [Folsomia candida]|uniref:Serum response factor-binding protein 1 n=1 Tax=Folsomia candida TaxID=158441 RepID=A0A226CX52_FOLCA|nr:Serum response factor-binding protein 1 [Folsomia candida]